MIKLLLPESISFQLLVIILNSVYYTTISIALLTATVCIHQGLKKVGISAKKSFSFVLCAIILAVPLGYISSKMANMFYSPPDMWSGAFFIQECMTGQHHTFHASILLPIVGISFLIKIFKLPFGRVWDTIFLYVPLTHAIARVGCLLVGCCWGEMVHVSIWNSTYQFKNPVPLYSIGLNLLLFSYLKMRFNRIYFEKTDNSQGGTIVAFYLLIYGSFRFFLEMIRTNPVIAFGLTQAQLVMIGFFTAGLILLIYIKFFHENQKVDQYK